MNNFSLLRQQMVKMQLQSRDITNEKVLDVGAGSSYQAAILSLLVKKSLR